MLEIADKIIGICQEPLCFETILKKLFSDYELTMNYEQYFWWAVPSAPIYHG